jgi:hypothetical protein
VVPDVRLATQAEFKRSLGVGSEARNFLSCEMSVHEMSSASASVVNKATIYKG